MSHVYRICGLTVACDIELPGARPAPAGAPPEVRLRRDAVPTELEGASVRQPRWEADARRLLMRVEGVGRFLVSDGCDIAFEPAPQAEAADCAVYLLGTMFGVLLHQRGLVVMHASAVAVGGRAVLFCGRSGSGKSTLAALLGGRGYPVLGDDVGAVGLDAVGAPMLRADSRLLKLTDASVTALGLQGERRGRVAHRLAKHWVDPPLADAEGEAQLAAIYMLRAEPADAAPAITQPSAAERIALLQANMHRPQIVRRTADPGQSLAALARIAAACPVFRFGAPRDLARLPALAERLEAHWAELGLADAAAFTS